MMKLIIIYLLLILLGINTLNAQTDLTLLTPQGYVSQEITEFGEVFTSTEYIFQFQFSQVEEVKIDIYSTSPFQVERYSFFDLTSPINNSLTSLSTHHIIYPDNEVITSLKLLTTYDSYSILVTSLNSPQQVVRGVFKVNPKSNDDTLTPTFNVTHSPRYTKGDTVNILSSQSNLKFDNREWVVLTPQGSEFRYGNVGSVSLLTSQSGMYSVELNYYWRGNIIGQVNSYFFVSDTTCVDTDYEAQLHSSYIQNMKNDMNFVTIKFNPIYVLGIEEEDFEYFAIANSGKLYHTSSQKVTLPLHYTQTILTGVSDGCSYVTKERTIHIDRYIYDSRPYSAFRNTGEYVSEDGQFSSVQFDGFNIKYSKTDIASNQIYHDEILPPLSSIDLDGDTDLCSKTKSVIILDKMSEITSLSYPQSVEFVRLNNDNVNYNLSEDKLNFSFRYNGDLFTDKSWNETIELELDNCDRRIINVKYVKQSSQPTLTDTYLTEIKQNIILYILGVVLIVVLILYLI